MKSLNIFIDEGSSKKCPDGQYYCFTDKKCKKIPRGYFVGRRGYLEKEEEFIQKFRYEFFSVNSGSSVFKGSGMSLKKTSTTSQKKGTAYKIYGCGMMGNANNPEILVPLEKIIILAH